MTTCTVAALPSPICDSMSSSFAGPCFASFVSRNLPWRYSATSRALRSLSTTSSSSPAFGAPDRPSTTTGSEGPASVTGWPFSSNIARTRPNSWPAMIGSPGFSVPRLTSTVATAPRPFSMLDSITTPAARPSRVALSSSTSACSRMRVEQLVDALRRCAPRRSRTACRRPTLPAARCACARSFLTFSGSASPLSILVTATTIGTSAARAC